MAIELKQTVKMSQQLLITPQLQQAIKLLQLSRVELVETIQKEMLENPVLEESSDSSEGPDAGKTAELSNNSASTETSADDASDSAKDDFNWENYVEASQNSYAYEPRGMGGAASNDDLPNYENIVTSSSTLHDHLEWQTHMGDFTDDEKQICEAIIGNLDDNGYLQMSLKEMAEKTDYSFEELEDALCIIQDFEPLGVGASSLQECLLLQIKGFAGEKKYLKEIIEHHLSFIEKRDYSSIAKKLSIPVGKAKDLAEIIYTLEPKPGRRFSQVDTQYITPDVYIKKVGQEYVVVLNEDGMPKLQISKLYRKAILKEAAQRKSSDGSASNLESEAKDYIQDKLKAALWLIKSIHQRQKTMYKVTKAISQFQRDFLENGVQALKPLVLKEVADDIGVHESTVSRATSGKYVHTPQGIFELKYFFNVGLSSQTGTQDFANEAVKQRVRQIIAQEDQKSPLSDQAVADLLKSENISIARRTVAKYREMLGILPSSRRKRLN